MLGSASGPKLGKGRNLLSLDGGGVRGLSTLYILKHLMELIDQVDPPKPCDVFDMIAGTSTGGLLAVMLGRLEMDINSCINAYIGFSDRVFQKQRRMIKADGKVQGRYDSEELKNVIQEMAAGHCNDRDALLYDVKSECKIFVCATRKENKSIVRLRSYRNSRFPAHLLSETKIWEACRATSAATSFFEPVTFGTNKNTFIDGALGSNNPVVELWTEAQSLWAADGTMGDNINCLVSIGTGVPSLKPFGDKLWDIGKSLIEIATETEKTARTFAEQNQGLLNSGKYFRFNVTQGLQNIKLEDAAERPSIVAATDVYLEDLQVFMQMDRCKERLATTRRVSPIHEYVHGGTVLHRAAYVGLPEVLRELLGSGASPDWRDGSGRTALHVAASNGRTAAVQVLLQKSEMDVRCQRDQTPLHCAAYKGHTDIVKMFLDAGASPSATDVSGFTALHYAAQAGHDESATNLLGKEADIDPITIIGESPLHLCSKNGHSTLVEILLSKNANIEARDSARWTPLHYAAEHGSVKVVELLINRGAKHSATEKDGETPLHCAAEKGQALAADTLLKNGADKDASDYKGMTPLHYAADNGHEAVAKVLLDRCVTIDALDTYRRTPLHYAAGKGHDNLARLLLEKGAQKDARDAYDCTPLYHAVDNDRADVARSLIREGADINALDGSKCTPLYRAVEKSHVSVVTMLLTEGADTDARDDKGQYPLHYAARLESETIARSLVQKMDDVDPLDQDGHTPLLIALHAGCVPIAKMLIENGCRTDVQGKDGCSPFDLASRIDDEGIKSLLCAPVDVGGVNGHPGLRIAEMNLYGIGVRTQRQAQLPEHDETEEDHGSDSQFDEEPGTRREAEESENRREEENHWEDVDDESEELEQDRGSEDAASANEDSPSEVEESESETEHGW